MEFISEALSSRQGAVAVIGHAEVVCTLLGRTKRSCTATYVLPKGRIVTDGVIRNRLMYEQAITGGTEFYDSARGTLVVTTTGLRPRRQLLVFRLVDLTGSQAVNASAAQPPTAALLPPTPTAGPNADRRQPRRGQAGNKAGTGRPAGHKGHGNGRHSR